MGKHLPNLVHFRRRYRKRLTKCFFKRMVSYLIVHAFTCANNGFILMFWLATQIVGNVYSFIKLKTTTVQLIADIVCSLGHAGKVFTWKTFSLSIFCVVFQWHERKKRCIDSVIACDYVWHKNSAMDKRAELNKKHIAGVALEVFKVSIERWHMLRCQLFSHPRNLEDRKTSRREIYA